MKKAWSCVTREQIERRRDVAADISLKVDGEVSMPAHTHEKFSTRFMRWLNSGEKHDRFLIFLASEVIMCILLQAAVLYFVLKDVAHKIC